MRGKDFNAWVNWDKVIGPFDKGDQYWRVKKHESVNFGEAVVALLFGG